MPRLVVEEAGALLDESDAELLGRAADGAVVLTASGCGNVFDA